MGWELQPEFQCERQFEAPLTYSYAPKYRLGAFHPIIFQYGFAQTLDEFEVLEHESKLGESPS
jgi:hypothetical protein